MTITLNLDFRDEVQGARSAHIGVGGSHCRLRPCHRSGSTNLNSEISGNSDVFGLTDMVGQKGVFHGKLRKKSSVARRVRRQHTGAFKAQVALAALREDKTMAQLCQEFDLHANQISEWKRQLLERAADVFGGADPPKPVDLQPLHAKIGQLTLENDFLERALTKAGLLSAR